MRSISTMGILFAAVAACSFPVLADEYPVQVGTFGQEVATFYAPDEEIPGGRVTIIPTPNISENMTGPVKFDRGEKHRVALLRARDHLRFRANSLPYNLSQLALDANEKYYCVLDNELFEESGRIPKKLTAEDKLGRIWGNTEVRGVAVTPTGDLWFASPAGIAVRSGDQWKFITGREGLPFNDFTCLAAGADGSVWMGTNKGVIRYQDGEWAYRQGKRWLPDDYVHDIFVDDKGGAWISTRGGVAHIERRPMTLSEKAAYYEEEMELIKRTPFRYTAEVSLPEAGVKRDVVHHDSDNDGLWTGMYGAGECFAYGVTGEPAFKKRATEAFEALRFLQKVTQGGKHSPPKGYVARTIRPIDDGDPNIGRIERDRKSHEDDALWKVYEPRWPKSADGKWYWKSDTSSDELDGHYFLYAAYYDMVAETDEEKERVREVVRDLTDHFLEHDFNLIDHDGTVTRWGTFSPKDLNHNADWYVERGLNSLSMLSYLTVALHVTGEERYEAALRLLIDEHGYDMNAMVPKLQRGVGSGNQSDDEMAFMSFYNLLKYTKDEELHSRLLRSFWGYWRMEFPEMNPFFNFAFAAVSLGESYENIWGTVNVQPFNGWLDDSLATLKGFPLDRLNWGHENSHRIDIVPLLPQNAIDPDLRTRPGRGYRVNGKVIPVEERHFNHWNTDPWRLDYGGNGRGLGNGTVFLLPYYMGLYHGFIEKD